MARPNRGEVISPDVSCIVPVTSRAVRRSFLLVDDPLTGKNYDYRKGRFEISLQYDNGFLNMSLEDYLALLDWTQCISNRLSCRKIWQSRDEKGSENFSGFWTGEVGCAIVK